jgi:hypothetical protein
MNRIIIGAALAAAVSLGAAPHARAQSPAERVAAARRAEASRDVGRERDRRDDDRGVWAQRSRDETRLDRVSLGEYLRGISLDRSQRYRVERAWDSRRSREQRLRAVRASLSRSQQRRFDANVTQIERRYGIYDSNRRRW